MASGLKLEEKLPKAELHSTPKVLSGVLAWNFLYRP
jgi:hypothetical protein